MKKICLCLIFCGLFLYGCVERLSQGHLSRAKSRESREQKSNPQVIAKKADGKFPKFLVGVWDADTFRWTFKFEPDGKISKLVHTIGVPIKVEEGFYSQEGDANSFEAFVLGPCDTSYDPNSKILKVSIILDYFLIQIPAGILEGSSKDLFEGPVSEKDLTWNVKWRNYGTLKGASPPDVNAIDANPEPLIFRKVNLKGIPREH